MVHMLTEYLHGIFLPNICTEYFYQIFVYITPMHIMTTSCQCKLFVVNISTKYFYQIFAWNLS